MRRAELLAPAGDFATARAAFAAGADAVYCGLKSFSARAFATNFSLEELSDLLRLAKDGDKRVYVTLNTLLGERDLKATVETLARLEECPVDGLIVQDLGLARLVRTHFPRLPLHASTQLGAHNLEGVLALKELGFTRVVLARELPLADISSIASRCGDMEIECFIHGALCYSLSGLCLFGAMEKGRSGNRGACPYCCRLPVADGKGGKSFPFSMKDLRLGEDVRRLVAAGVASLKIEGRMKSPLYVASVTRYYRDILDEAKPTVTTEDLETVFSRRTTRLSFDRPHTAPSSEDVIDSKSLGHLGAFIGVVKKVTRDREGVAWLRFHTARALERHDGLQFDVLTSANRPLGIGIQEMRTALSRQNAFRVPAHSDVEVRLDGDIVRAIRPGLKIYCSMSNAVKNRFPIPSFRRSAFLGLLPLAIRATLSETGVEIVGTLPTLALEARVSLAQPLAAARDVEKVRDAAETAFRKLGESLYFLDSFDFEDPSSRFVPSSLFNDLRRQLLERLDAAREARCLAKVESARAAVDDALAARSGGDEARACRRVKIRSDQEIPEGAWDEVVVALSRKDLDIDWPTATRLALPVYTAESDFPAVRRQVKRLLARGYDRWEAADLATLRLLKNLGVRDITADWTLYALNPVALAALVDLGVRRVVVSPEASAAEKSSLALHPAFVEFLARQSTPLFLSLHAPDGAASSRCLATFERDGLVVTTAVAPRVFEVPKGCASRFDFSWEAL